MFVDTAGANTNKRPSGLNVGGKSGSVGENKPNINIDPGSYSTVANPLAFKPEGFEATEASLSNHFVSTGDARLLKPMSTKCDYNDDMTS